MRIGLIKVFRDIQKYMGRTLLTLAGVAMGVTAVGAVLAAYAILNREMNRNFMQTHPASIVLTVPNLDERAAGLIRRNYGQTEIELRKTIQARVGKGDGSYGAIYLRAIPDFHRLKVDTFTLEKGRFPADDSEMALERDCLKILKNVKTGRGEILHLMLPGGGEEDVRLSGLVHAPGLAPASMENYSYGFVSLELLKRLGYRGWYDELRIVSYRDRFDREKMKTMAISIRKLLARNGYAVTRVDVPKPGKHPHASQLDSFLFLLQAFTLIALLTACIIIMNLLSFIMSRQTRAIAVMKTVGAGTADITFPYFVYVLLISFGSLIPGIPLALAGGRGYSDFAAYILNFKIGSYAVPAWVIAVQIGVGILVPLASAAYPILKSCSKSVLEGLSERTGGAGETGRQGVPMKKVWADWNSGVVMPLNNLFRKRLRTVLAVAALATGGVLFMTAQNIVASIDKTVETSMNTFRWDYNVRLARDYSADRLEKVFGEIEGLRRVEVWRIGTALLKKGDGLDSAYYQIKIVPDDTRLLNLSPGEEKALKSGDGSIIVTNGLIGEEPWLHSGKSLTMQVGRKSAEVTIAGVVNEVPPMTIVYMGQKAYRRYFGEAMKPNVMASAATRDPVRQKQISKTIEAQCQVAGIEIADNWNIYLLRKAFVDHLRVIVTFLSVIAMLAILVGGLSIASAVGINVSERKREIGVLRAVGVNGHQIVGMTLLEVALMGLAGWLAGLAVSYPISVAVGNYFGRIFLEADLINVISLPGAGTWLILSLLAALTAGLIPAWTVAQAPLREMLGYE